VDDTDKKIATFVIIISLAIMSYGGYRVIRGELAKGAQEELFVQRGDIVSVEYTGLLYDSRIYGTEPRVFDTNRRHVANNNITHPKTLTYTWRDSDEPFKFEVGTGSVIVGWETNIIGMKIGESATWTIAPEDAYQPRMEELVRTYNRTMTNPVYESISRTRFMDEYAGYPAVMDVPLIHSYWGWPAKIFSVSETHITIESLPVPRETYTTTYGWNTYVTSVNSSADGGKGIITMEHQPLVSDLVHTVELVRFDSDMAEIHGLQNQYQRASGGIVVAVGFDNFQVDYNSETYGVTLIFQVTLLDIDRK